MKIDVKSEIGELEGVVLHTPGPEVENMTPQNAERALYSDILNLSVAKREYRQLEDLLNTVTRTFQVRELLESALASEDVRNNLVRRICTAEGQPALCDDLMALDARQLAGQLLEGVALKRDNLTRFLSEDRFSLPPLYNFFFTRDASMSIMGEVLIGRMATPVRDREAVVMEAIFNHSAELNAPTVNPASGDRPDPAISVEGGDVLVARDDILLIGNGSRTSTQGIDFIIERIKAQKDRKRHILVQELPHDPESFIHLDMVFTLLDRDRCMVFEPLMLKPTRFHTVHILIENGQVTSIREENSLIEALAALGMDLKPICCGGKKDAWHQEREQWHSGANFFALAPGKVLGYARNVHTMEEMNANGFEIIPADEIIGGRRILADAGRCVVTLEGSELPRGGGGARCMTMPVRRKPVNW
ncbi:MAG: arginine deiminase [Proteobacteria bacterium]|nr:MAG: arginine deiminase [Pseudomonadota bacterium]PIE67700.1 MAG: arginine deiminase [Deltaproteobacteria bacterium]